MTDPTEASFDSETMRAFEAEIERAARAKAEEIKATMPALNKTDEPSDTTPFGRKLRELGFDKL